MSTPTLLVEPEDRYSHDARSYHLSGLPTNKSWTGVGRSFIGIMGVSQALVSHLTSDGKITITILINKGSRWDIVEPQVISAIKKIFGLTDLHRPDIRDLLAQIDLQKAFSR